MSTILAIDAAGPAFAVALLVDRDVVRVVVGDSPRDHSRRLLQAVDEVLAGTIERIDAFAVTRGPGSFAGVRVGMAVTAGLAMARALPVIGIGTLEAVAAAAGAGGWMAIHPAGRGTVAAQPFRDGVALGPPRVALEGDAFEWPIAGEGASALGGREVTAGERCRAVASLALARLATGDHGPPSALYLREPNITAPRVRQPAAT